MDVDDREDAGERVSERLGDPDTDALPLWLAEAEADGLAEADADGLAVALPLSLGEWDPLALIGDFELVRLREAICVSDGKPLALAAIVADAMVELLGVCVADGVGRWDAVPVVACELDAVALAEGDPPWLLDDDAEGVAGWLTLDVTDGVDCCVDDGLDDWLLVAAALGDSVELRVADAEAWGPASW